MGFINSTLNNFCNFIEKIYDFFEDRKIIASTAFIFLLLFSVTVATILVQSRQDVRQRAEETGKPKSGYNQGEILFKLREHIPPLEAKTINFGDNSVLFSDLDETSIPNSIINLDKRYKIKSIENVFKKTNDPQTELKELKQKFANKIFIKRKIDEQNFLKIDLTKTYKITFESKGSPIEQIVQELSNNPELQYVEPNYIFKAQLVPNDPYYTDHYPDNISLRDTNWNSPYDYLWNLKKIDAENAWDISSGNANITVAILDTGIDYTHPEFGGCNLEQVNNNQCVRIAPGYNFINNDNDPIDDMGHGTQVAGVVGANGNNFIGTIGLSWNSRLLPIKVLDEKGEGTSDSISEGVKYTAYSGTEIINMSFANDVPIEIIPKTLKDSLDYAYYLDTILVAASGNSGNIYPDCPSGFWPADYSFVIEVAASKEDDTPASYSNCSKDVAAPGGEKADIISLASNKATINPTSLIGNIYTRSAGTSMAAPLVSALSALILSIHPTYSSNEIRSVLKTTADSMFNDIYGTGRINAFKALKFPKVTLAPEENITITSTLTATTSPTLTITSTPAAVFCTACKADLNANGMVDINDLSIASNCIDKSINQCLKPQADINNNSVVDQTDVECIQSQFGQKCTSQTSSNTPEL